MDANVQLRQGRNQEISFHLSITIDRDTTIRLAIKDEVPVNHTTSEGGLECDLSS